MKKWILLFTFLCCIFLLKAQQASVSQIAEKINALSKAMIDADSTSLHKLVSERLSYGHSSGQIDDKKIFIEKIVSGKSDYVTIELRGQTIDVKKKLAIVRHELHAQTNDAGKPGEIHLRVLQIWHKEKRNWRLVARQAVKITQ